MVDRIDETAARARLGNLNPDWRLDGDKLARRFEVTGFGAAVLHANAAAFLGEREGHHPDIAFGWGYCEVRFTTHDAGGLTEKDFACAAKLDALVAG